jgi:hypothetical protein
MEGFSCFEFTNSDGIKVAGNWFAKVGLTLFPGLFDAAFPYTVRILAGEDACPPCQSLCYGLAFPVSFEEALLPDLVSGLGGEQREDSVHIFLEDS